MPVAKIIAAAALLALVGGQREFGIGGGPVLCVPESEIDPDLTPYTPNPKQLQPGGGFAFAIEARRDTLHGSLRFVDDADRRHHPPHIVCGANGCTRTTLIDGFLVAYELREQDASLVAALDRLLREKIAAWRENCHATDRM